MRDRFDNLELSSVSNVFSARNLKGPKKRFSNNYRFADMQKMSTMTRLKEACIFL